MKKFKRLAQLPGLAPPMDAPQEPQGDLHPIIPGPLDSVEKIILDAKIFNRLADSDDLENIALEIWEEYGGKKNGGVYTNKRGKREERDAERDIETVNKERERNKNKKWERLSKDKEFNTINKVTSLEGLMNSIQQISLSHIKKLKGKGQQSGGMGGGLPF
jgi:hypothetical protein